MLALDEEYVKVTEIELSVYKKNLYNKKTKTSSQSVFDFSTKIERITNNLMDNGETITESTLKWILYEELPKYQSQLIEKYCNEAVPYFAFLNYTVTLEKVAIKNKKKDALLLILQLNNLFLHRTHTKLVKLTLMDHHKHALYVVWNSWTLYNQKG